MRRIGTRFHSLLLIVLLSPAAVAGPGQRVDDARYGEVLFQFYQRDYFTAITHLMAARSQGRIGADWYEAELLLGGLKLSYGLTNAAEKTFQRLLAREPEPSVRSRAWYYLAELAFEKGRLEQAAHALAQIGEELPPELEGKRQLLDALVHMEQGDFAGAAERLSPWRGPPEDEVYARYNLGIASIRSGEVERGVELLDRIGRIRTDDEEMRTLRDKANLAAGRALLKKRPAQAKRSLERVRLEGPLSNRALLGAGWAEMAAGRQRAALVPWSVLRKRPLDDPAVQEAMLAAPYAMLQLDARDQAAEMYHTATERLAAEARRIDQAMNEIRNGRLLDAAIGIDPRTDQLPPVDRIPGRSYLGTLIASHGFRRSLQDYQDVEALGANLRYWRGRLDDFEDALAAHRARFEQKLPQIQRQLDELAPEALEERYQALKAGLPISAGDDLRSLEQQLAQLRERRASLESIRQRAQEDFRAYGGRIQLMRERIDELLPKIERTLTRQRRVLEARALQALGARRDALRSQVTQARFILAQLYDPAADRSGREQ
jgi:tetratricopeptide (TPR) repeat protein